MTHVTAPRSRWRSCRSRTEWLEGGVDDVQAIGQLLRWLVGEADPEGVGAVAEPDTRGDEGPLSLSPCQMT